MSSTARQPHRSSAALIERTEPPTPYLSGEQLPTRTTRLQFSDPGNDSVIERLLGAVNLRRPQKQSPYSEIEALFKLL